MDKQQSPTGASVGPLSFAIGITVLLVGLIVSPLVIAPLGAAIAFAAGFAWVRGNQPKARRPAAPPAEVRGDGTAEERFPRSRLLERATLGLGGLIALGVALPAAGFAILPSFLGQRRGAVDLGPIDAFPEGKFVVATFLSDPRAGEVTRRAAYVRNNGLLGNLPSFTIMSSRCTHVGCPTQPNGPLFLEQRTAAGTDGGEVRLIPTQHAGVACPWQRRQFDNEGNRIADRRHARSTVMRLDPLRASLARPSLPRQPRGRHRRTGPDPQLRAEGRRRTRHRPRVVALPSRPAVMSIYELDIGWAATPDQLRYLHWELLACDAIRGVFRTKREDRLAVIFNGESLDFRIWARSVAPEAAR
jgi:hypothetical protein